MIETHRMHLKPEHFQKVRDKRKEVEFRLYDEKRKKVQVEDGIVFVNTDTHEELFTVVRAIVVGKLPWIQRALNPRMNDEFITDTLGRIYGLKTVYSPIDQQPVFVAFVLEV